MSKLVYPYLGRVKSAKVRFENVNYILIFYDIVSNYKLYVKTTLELDLKNFTRVDNEVGRIKLSFVAHDDLSIHMGFAGDANTNTFFKAFQSLIDKNKEREYRERIKTKDTSYDDLIREDVTTEREVELISFNNFFLPESHNDYGFRPGKYCMAIEVPYRMFEANSKNQYKDIYRREQFGKLILYFRLEFEVETSRGFFSNKVERFVIGSSGIDLKFDENFESVSVFNWSFSPNEFGLNRFNNAKRIF